MPDVRAPETEMRINEYQQILSTNPVAEIDQIVAALAPKLWPAGRRTARALSVEGLREGIEATAAAKRRTRRYSSDGFVPNAYRYRCDIQYIDCERTESGEWRIALASGGAQRRHGRGPLLVVQ